MKIDKEIIAIIPARGGSKRVPGKNIKLLAGKPLLAYSIEHAKQSKYINRIIVSTDNQEIADVALKYGAEVPFLRPAEISGDDSTDFEVFRHTLDWLNGHEGYCPDMIVQLRPTSPLRKVEDVDKAIEALLSRPDADSARTVIEPQSSPYKMYMIGENGLLNNLLPQGAHNMNAPDQTLPKSYRHIGTADVIWPKTILEKKSISGDAILAITIEHAYSGINTQEDWDFYEFLLNKKNQ